MRDSFQDINFDQSMSTFQILNFYIKHIYSIDTHSIDTDDLKQGLLYESETNVMDNNEYFKHFLLLIMQAVAMFVVSIFLYSN